MTEDVDNKTPDPASGEATALPEMPPPKRARWRRPSFKLLVFRIVVYGVVAFAALLLIAYTGIRFFVKSDDIKAFVKNQVEEQTGGRLDIGAVQFNVLSGIQLANVQFYPPAPGDTRGVHYGGEVIPIPLANFEALNIGYSIPKMFAGRLHLRAMQLVAPEFHLRQTDGIWNFDSILAYRAVKFPPDPEDEKKTEDTSSPRDSLLPFSPALLYMPIEILTQNVGIKGLRLDLIKEEEGKIAQILVTNGLTFDMGLHWFHRDSTMWFGMMNPFENPLELDIKDGVRDAAGKLTGAMAQTVLLRTALSMRLSFDNLKKIAIDVATRVIEVKTAVAGYKDLATYAKVRITINDDYKGLKIETLETEIADALSYELKGTVTLPNGNFEAIGLNLLQKFNLDLKNAAALAKPFVPDLTAGGTISFDGFKIEGVVEPAKFANMEKGVPLPYVSGVIWVEGIFANLPGTGLSMEPISGDVSLAAGPALTGSGSQVDLAMNMDIPKLSLTHQNAKIGAVTAGVEGMQAKLTTRLLWPEMIAPVFKLNVEAEHVLASGKGIAPLDAPLYVDVDADGRQDLARVALSANMELTDLIEFNAMADCQAKCTRFRANINGRLESLERLHSVALPLGGVLGFAQFMPTKMAGTVDFQFGARGKLPDPLTTPVPELLKEADVRFTSQFNLAKLNVKIPFYNVDVKGFENRVLASGSLREQKIELAQKFDSLTLELPPKIDATTGVAVVDAKPMPIEVNRFSFDVAITNTIDGPLNLANPLPQLVTDVETWLYIGKLNVKGVLPRPVSEIQIDSVLHQAHMTEIKVKSVDVRLPDYGTSVKVLAETILGPDYMPKQLKTMFEAHVAHSGDERLPGGIKTSGKIDVKVSVDSPDMRLVTVDGSTTFDRFNVTIPNPQGQVGNLLVVEDVEGQIPFKQRVTLPPLDVLMKPKVDPKVALVKTDVTVAKVAAAEVVAVDSIAEVPNLADAKVTDKAAEASKAMDKAMDKYFAKNEDKLLDSTNIVALVDYASIRPFYPDRRPLSIKRIEVANLEMSKMEFDLELRQNWFAVNQFVIGFLGGKIQGDFQLAFDADAKSIETIPRMLRTSVHMTRLDTRKLIERFPNLQGKRSSWNVFSNPYLDGTVHLLFDLQTSEMSGGVEITSIGKEQLGMMLSYVDPFEQNPNISSIRKALAFGDVRQVSIPLKNGEIGMDVDVRVLGVPWPTPKLSRFPISQIIQNMKDQALNNQERKPASEAKPDSSPPAAATTTPDVSG